MPVKSVDEFILKFSEHGAFISELRKIFLDLDLEEHIKWGAPVYTYKGQNLVSIGIFRNHKGIWFFQGALLSDPDGKLENAQEGKTQSMRHLKFMHSEKPDMDLVKRYVIESMAHASQGKKVEKAKPKTVAIPEMLKTSLQDNPELNKAFSALSKGLQNEFSEYINQAKQEQTKLSRLQKITPMILEGQGLNDKYRKK